MLFPQLARVIQRYVIEKVIVEPPADRLQAFMSPNYGWVIERLLGALHPDAANGEAPELPIFEKNRGEGSTSEVDFWTSREVREIVRSHVNYVVADTQQWEQSAAYLIDTHPAVDSFVKNAGLGFAIPYIHNGQPHDFEPDFIIRLAGYDARFLILETKATTRWPRSRSRLQVDGSTLSMPKVGTASGNSRWCAGWAMCAMLSQPPLDRDPGELTPAP